MFVVLNTQTCDEMLFFWLQRDTWKTVVVSHVLTQMPDVSKQHTTSGASSGIHPCLTNVSLGRFNYLRIFEQGWNRCLSIIQLSRRRAPGSGLRCYSYSYVYQTTKHHCKHAGGRSSPIRVCGEARVLYSGLLVPNPLIGGAISLPFLLLLLLLLLLSCRVLLLCLRRLVTHRHKDTHTRQDNRE